MQKKFMLAPANSSDALKNHLLAALPEDEFARLYPKLEAVSLSLDDIIYDSGEPMNYVYFPTTAIVFLLFTSKDGVTVEIGMHGNDGAVGVALIMGSDSMPYQAVVQSAGGAFRMKAQAIRDEFALGGQLQLLLRRFTLVLITQISQTAVCNRLHSIEQQVCRWLLYSHDRLQSNKLVMTHDLIAKMLGVRRESVSIAARRLQNNKLITYARGTITILDRQGLEAGVCECYRVVKDEYERLFGS
jgi:CRP-like cAMP-binding protein